MKKIKTGEENMIIRNTKLSIITFLISIFFAGPLVSNAPILIASIPKCGTHLLNKALALILKNNSTDGVACFITIQQSEINKALTNGSILGTHALCTEHNKDIVKKNKLKGFFIYRDPRDMLVSYPYWMYKFPSIWKDYQQLTVSELIYVLILDFYTSFKQLQELHHTCLIKEGMHDLRTVRDFYIKGYLPWRNIPEVYTTSFEKLVGPQGGGTLQEQLIELKNIARHIDIELSDERALEIANNLFGNTGSFREGKIGSWKTHFTLEHKNIFKAICGDLLEQLGYEKNKNW